MNRTLKVLLAIAIVISTLEVAALTVDMLASTPETASPLQGFAADAGLRWRVYSAGAVAALLAGFLLRRRRQLAGDALVIAGVYLLILANNGGLFARGYQAPRLVTSILTLGLLLLLAIRGGTSRSDADA